MKNLRNTFMICGAVMTAVLCLSLGFGAVNTQAGTGGSTGRTKVIYAKNEDDFASETSKLAKKSQGLSVMSNGEILPYSSARLIVRVKDGKKQSFTGFGANTVVTSGYGVSVIQFSTSEKARSAAKKIAALSTVSYVEPDDCTLDLGDTQITQIEGSDAGGDTESSSSMEGLSNPFGYADDEDVTFASSLSTSAAKVSTGRMSWGASYIQADQYAAYVKKTTKRSIKVAVVDSGVSSHRMLNGRKLAGKDFVDNDNDPTDKNGHGTHVAGTIVDCTPGLNVKILPVRVMNASGVGNPSVVGNGVRYAVNKGAKVINLSLGGYSHYKYLEECISYANRKGVTVVIAAGNGSYNTKRVCPAHLSAPIIVSAINKNGKRAYFSNYGSSVDVAAPGVGIRSCWKNGGFATADGTSMAAPHISAAAAMYRLTHPSYSPAKIEKFIKNYAKDLGSKGNDKYYGRGVPRMKAAIPVSKKKKKASINLEKPYSLSAMPPQDIEVHVNGPSETSPGMTGDLTGIGSGAVSGIEKIVSSAAETAARMLSPDDLDKPGETGSAEALSDSLQPYAAGPQPSSNEKQSAAALTENAQAAFFSTEDPALSARDSETSAPESALSAQDPASGTPEPAPPARDPAVEESVPEEADEKEEKGARKLYLYPREQQDNAVIRDGSIVVGDRLALDAEIVPEPGREVVLDWTSGDPAVASVDAGGVVQASSEGTAVITASISGNREEKGSVYPGLTRADEVPLSGSGSFTVKVVEPFAMTGDASYRVGPDDGETALRARIRVPGTLERVRESDSSEESLLNEPARYVLAMFREHEETCTLLGAVEIGVENMGEPRKGGSFDVLSLDRSDVDGGKADLYLTVAADRLREAAGQESTREEDRRKADDQKAESQEVSWDCSLIIYRESAFEMRARAESEDNEELADRIDAEAVCRCSFTLKFTLPPAEEARKAAETDREETRQKTPEKEPVKDSEIDSRKDPADKTDGQPEDTAGKPSASETGEKGEETETPDSGAESPTASEAGTVAEKKQASGQETGPEKASGQTGSVKESVPENKDKETGSKEEAGKEEAAVKEKEAGKEEGAGSEKGTDPKKGNGEGKKASQESQTGSEKESGPVKKAESAKDTGSAKGNAAEKQNENESAGSGRDELQGSRADQNAASTADRTEEDL